MCVSRSVRSSDCFAILRNLLKTHMPFPVDVLRTLRNIQTSETDYFMAAW